VALSGELTAICFKVCWPFENSIFNDILKNALTRGTPEYHKSNDPPVGDHWLRLDAVTALGRNLFARYNLLVPYKWFMRSPHVLVSTCTCHFSNQTNFFSIVTDFVPDIEGIENKVICLWTGTTCSVNVTSTCSANLYDMPSRRAPNSIGGYRGGDKGGELPPKFVFPDTFFDRWFPTQKRPLRWVFWIAF